MIKKAREYFYEKLSNVITLQKKVKVNKNDTIKVMGQPHSKSINDENEWIYIERVLTKGEFHKLGQNILLDNNVLVLDFDKFGIFLIVWKYTGIVLAQTSIE